MSEKLQKVLATLGLGSRRELEKYIEAGIVSVDGKVATLGDRVEGHEVIRVDGNIVKTAVTSKPICRVLMYNKPEGQMCTKRDPEGRPTVYDRLPTINNGRWLYVGRLDVNTSGLLLFTTDGELANRLMHPSHEVERVYAVRVFGEVTPEHIKQLETNVELEDGSAHFDKVIFVGGEGINQWYNVTLKEGRKREVRRLWEALGLKVSRLKRIKYANIELGKLPQGGWYELTLTEVNSLRNLVGLKNETETMVSEKTLSVRESFVKNRQVKRAVRNYQSRVKENSLRNAHFEKNGIAKSVEENTENRQQNRDKSFSVDSKKGFNNKFARFDEPKRHNNKKFSKKNVHYIDDIENEYYGRDNNKKGSKSPFNKNNKKINSNGSLKRDESRGSGKSYRKTNRNK